EIEMLLVRRIWGTTEEPNFRKRSDGEKEEEAHEGGNRRDARTSRQSGDARKDTERNCMHPRRKHHDLTSMAKGSAEAATAAQRLKPRRSNFADADRRRASARKFTTAPIGDRFAP